MTPDLSHIEPATLRALADAAEALIRAERATAHGFVSDECRHMLAQMRNVFRVACGGLG